VHEVGRRSSGELVNGMVNTANALINSFSAKQRKVAMVAMDHKNMKEGAPLISPCFSSWGGLALHFLIIETSWEEMHGT
jgi:hypothetical protein